MQDLANLVASERSGIAGGQRLTGFCYLVGQVQMRFHRAISAVSWAD